MRNRISLIELQEQWKKEQRQKSYRAAHKYDGLESCRKNVIRCGCARKLKYCKPTEED